MWNSIFHERERSLWIWEEAKFKWGQGFQVEMSMTAKPHLLLPEKDGIQAKSFPRLQLSCAPKILPSITASDMGRFQVARHLEPLLLFEEFLTL